MNPYLFTSCGRMSNGLERNRKRRRKMSNWKAAWALSWPALAVAAPLYAERVALVIGNGAYRGGEITELSNPGNDARAVAGKLRGLGFEVISGIDLGRPKFFDLLRKFGEQAAGAEAALLFYAGHGLQVEGKNYLIPVDAGSLKEKTDLRERAVNLDYVLEEMKGKTNLVFLDACRNNPFRGFRGSGGRGLAVVSAKSMGGGVLISYAAEPGELALDGEGQNSPYTEALLKHMGRQGVSVGDMLTGVKAEVEDATGGAQHPWTSVSMRAPFYFVPGTIIVPPPGCDTELLKSLKNNWEEAKKSKREGPVEVFIKEYESCRGAGVLVTRAKNLLDDLARARKAKEEAARKAKEEAARKAKEDAEKARVELRRPGRRFQDCAECPEMVVIPAGSFMMGSPESEEGRIDNEGPVHPVEIGEPLAVGAYEVTFEEWDACVAAGGCGGYRPDDAGWGRGRRPVINVSWDDADSYVSWLSRKTGRKYRLLSEAEWEYAARAGTRTRYSFGNKISPKDANYGDIGKTRPVGRYRANGYGLYDMHGNVREWVQDCFSKSYEEAPSNGDAWGRRSCGIRGLRGGSWVSISWHIRSAIRFWDFTGSRDYDNGFRVARTLGP